MTTTLITHARIVYPGQRIALGEILLQAGRIAAIDPAAAATGGSSRGRA
jgi:dihydroorotase-like cyclic amidohydrolase